MKKLRVMYKISILAASVGCAFIVSANPASSQATVKQQGTSVPPDVALEFDCVPNLDQEPNPRALLANIQKLKDQKTIYAGLLQLHTVSQAHIKWLQEHQTYQPDDFHFALDLNDALTQFRDAVVSDELEVFISCESYRSSLLNSYRVESLDDLPGVFKTINSLCEKI
jgi:hypothetical protein